MTLRWKLAQALEIRWWQHYLRNKSTTDYSDWKSRYWQALLEEIGISDLEKNTARILDAGCGPAGIFMIFKHQKVVALDPLLKDYEAKLPHFKPANYPNVQFQAQALEDYTPEKDFDYVFCLNAINHVSDLDKCLDKLAEAVHTEGYLILSIDAHNHRFLKTLFRLLPGDVLHPHQFDLKAYQDMLETRGFVIEKTLLKKQAFIFNYYVLVAKKH
jgi:2-polyprenyl-6-hydroxyphenyl methylase/3-demethylubiquinone-9 3-methyltransferase